MPKLFLTINPKISGHLKNGFFEEIAENSFN